MALDIYLQAILAVIYGNELPDDVIRHVLTGQFGQSGGRVNRSNTVLGVCRIRTRLCEGRRPGSDSWRGHYN